ncbi:unnamed protein product [Prorocentrum cordatum]|uniref:Uncharacterized protein n=1 Tax=Prorocentrum cordatum TaxID=2364126 RepID=A0ABN9T6U5_9DINO|nr:unnamed protein product [Polarella glacialis]
MTWATTTATTTATTRWRAPPQKSAARPPASAGNAFYQSSMVVGKIAGAAVEEEDLRYLQHGSLPGLDELDDEFGAGLAAPLQAEERPYRSSLPGLDELDDEFGFGAEVPPADPAASPPFSGYGAGDPSAQWAVPPQSHVVLQLQPSSYLDAWAPPGAFRPGPGLRRVLGPAGPS